MTMLYKSLIRLAKLQYLLVILVSHISIAQEQTTVIGLFKDDPLELMDSLQLKCDTDGDKIKILDILYKTTGCRNSENRPLDSTAELNDRLVHQCTGKRICSIEAHRIKRPFLPKKPATCHDTRRHQINVIFTCVPQEEIKSMCESFTTEEYMGYLSTPSYPMLLKPGVPVAQCRCYLEVVPPTSKIRFTLLESNLAGNSSDEDTRKCELEVAKQYLGVEYNHGNSQTYMLCSHKYNIELEPSATFDLIFENPIDREAGALWIQYEAEDPAMVKVSCYEPVVTTTAPIHYTELLKDNGKGGDPWFDKDGRNYRLILGIVATCLFLLIVIAVIVIIAKYNRRINHYMLHKYSKHDKHERRKGREPLSQAVEPMVGTPQSYQETHFDSVDETMSCGKPTAHIPPQLSVNEKLNKVTQEDHDPKSKLANGKRKYSTFSSTYLANPQCDSDTEGSDSTVSKHSERSGHSPTTSETSSAPSVRRVAPPSTVHQSAAAEADPSVPVSVPARAPNFEDIWVRVNTPDAGAPVRSASAMSGPLETDRLVAMRSPTAASLTTERSRRDTPDAYRPLIQHEDSRSNSDDEEMDIKFVNRHLVSPYKAPILVVKPALKSSSRPPKSAPTGRRDSVKFSDIIQGSAAGSEYSASETDLQKRERIKAAIFQYSPMTSSKQSPPPRIPKKPKQRGLPGPIYSQPKLVVDLSSSYQPHKTKYLPNQARRLNSTTSLQSYPHGAKRAKRRYASDNDKCSSSSQELLYQSPTYEQLLAATRREQCKRTSSLPAPSRRRGAEARFPAPIGMSRRSSIPENDDELIIKIDNDLDTMMRDNPI